MKSDTNSVPIPWEPKRLVDELTDSLRATAQEVVPWFLENMPPMYFQDTSPEEQLGQLRAILAAKASGRPLEMVLKSKDDSQWTVMAPVNRPGMLAAMARQLPLDWKLRSAKIHSALDSNLLIIIFESGESPRFDPSDATQKNKLDETVKFAATEFPELTRDVLADHFTRCTAEAIRTLTPLRICRQKI
ncbi:MAG: hypothetical protein KDB53_21400, partial [Planctomycetes bacterium]|nr:hypothetical protein [Planctomycetota bacterium]